MIGLYDAVELAALSVGVLFGFALLLRAVDRAFGVRSWERARPLVDVMAWLMVGVFFFLAGAALFARLSQAE